MRTKNIKRLWPVPVTLGVMALAALLAFGLLAINGAQPVAAQDAASCEDGIDSNNNQNLTCSTVGDSVDVVFEAGVSSSVSFEKWVYITGGTKYSNVKVGVTTDTPSADITADLDEQGISIQGGDVLGERRSYTITVNRSQADSDGKVTLYVFPGDAADQGFEDPDGDDATKDREELNIDASDAYEATVLFYGAPAMYDKKSMMGSRVVSGAVSVSTTHMFTVTAQDQHGNMLGGSVVLEIADPDGKATFDNNATRIIAGITDGTTGNVNVKGLLSSGAIKIPVTATIQANGELEIMGTISRVGDAHTITSNTYICDGDEDTDGNSTVEADEMCAPVAIALASSDMDDHPDPVSVFKPENVFLIRSTAVDELDQANTVVTFTAKEQPATGESAVFDAPTVVPAVPADSEDNPPVAAQVGHIRVVVPETDIGKYNFEVSDSGNDAMSMVTVTVSGDAVDYGVAGDMWIPLDGEKTYTVTATDMLGNIPAADMDYMAAIRVRSVGISQDDDVVGLDKDGMVTLKARTGKGTFTILAPVDASQGDSATIRVIVNDVVQDTMTVYFGDAPTPPAMMPTAPSVAMAAVSGNSVTVTWMDGQNVGGHGVVLFTSDFSSWPHIGMGMGETHMFNNVSSGSYIAVVVALDAQGALMTNAQGGYIYTASTVITVP